DYTESVLFGRLSQMPGVGLVTIGGQQQAAMRVEVDPAALTSHGLTMATVRTALQQSTLKAAKGTIRGDRQTWGLSTNDQLDTEKG
ncbi:efflux RND transporter permease subunit, partial [Salmonella sp. M198]